MATVFTTTACSFCTKSHKKLKPCKRCKAVYYCSPSCKKAHKDVHSAVCGKDAMRAFEMEIQRNTTRMFENEKFIGLICPLIHKWNAFALNHIKCHVYKAADDVFVADFTLVAGPLESEHNVDLVYNYTTAKGKTYSYSMYVRFSREDCASEYQTCDKKLIDGLTSKSVAVRLNLKNNTITIDKADEVPAI
jgi:hypothetical protein